MFLEPIEEGLHAIKVSDGSWVVAATGHEWLCGDGAVRMCYELTAGMTIDPDMLNESVLPESRRRRVDPATPRL